MNQTIKINFRLQPDADGYPPVSVESLWANVAADGYVIDSIPFFTSAATVGDRVLAKRGEGSALWFDSVEQRSQHSLLRVVFFDVSYEEPVVARLTALGCGTERMQAYKLLAVDVPESVNLSTVQDVLREEAMTGHLDYEEPILRQ